MRGIANEVKRRTIFDFYRARADIICIQETHCTKELESIWRNEWGGNIFFSNGTSNSKGVAILINRAFYCDFLSQETDSEGRILLINLRIEGQCVSIINVYAPNKDTPQFIQEIAEIYVNANGGKIMVGDFNVAMEGSLDRYGTLHNNDKMQLALKEFLDQNYLVDVWRIRHPTETQFTWTKSTKDSFKASRLDYIFISRGIDQKVKNEMFLPGIMTDHRACHITIELSKTQRGVGFWKFNNTLLEDQEYVKETEQEIDLTIKCTENLCAIEIWEKLKSQIAKTTKEYAKKCSNAKKETICSLTEIVSELESRQPLIEAECTILEKAKSDLNDKLLERTRGIMFRSKANWYEFGEKGSKYFLGLEKDRYNAKTCYSLTL